MLHLTKLAVGVRDIEHLRALQTDRAWVNPPLRHRTRNSPRRRADVLDGGCMGPGHQRHDAGSAADTGYHRGSTRRPDPLHRPGRLPRSLCRWRAGRRGRSRAGAISIRMMRRRTCRMWRRPSGSISCRLRCAASYRRSACCDVTRQAAALRRSERTGKRPGR